MSDMSTNTIEKIMNIPDSDQDGFVTVKYKNTLRKEKSTPDKWDDDSEAVREFAQFKEVIPLKSTTDTKTPKNTPTPRFSRSKKNTATTSFTVGTSRIDQLESARRKRNQQRMEKNKLEVLGKMENSHEFSFDPRRKFTRACRNCERDEDGNYGVCTRRNPCTFAHSLEELKDPLCTWLDNCHHIDGRYDHHTQQLDKSRKCMFRHPHETREMYMKRTGKELPDLPPTAEHTRKIQQTPLKRAFVQQKTPNVPMKTRKTRWGPHLSKTQEFPHLPTFSAQRMQKRSQEVSENLANIRVFQVPKELEHATLEMAMEMGISFRIEIV